jgi:hypothetical protein
VSAPDVVRFFDSLVPYDVSLPLASLRGAILFRWHLEKFGFAGIIKRFASDNVLRYLCLASVERWLCPAR